MIRFLVMITKKTNQINTMEDLIGQQIKKYRTELGYSQLELSQAIGKTSPAYVSLIEKGQRNISAIDIHKISEFLRVPIQFFFSDGLSTCAFIEDRKILNKIRKLLTTTKQ